MARIAFPKTFREQSELFNFIREKHLADGAASPLLPYLALHNIVLADDEAGGLLRRASK